MEIYLLFLFTIYRVLNTDILLAEFIPKNVVSSEDSSQMQSDAAAVSMNNDHNGNDFVVDSRFGRVLPNAEELSDQFSKKKPFDVFNSKPTGNNCKRFDTPMNSNSICSNINSCQVTCLQGYASPHGVSVSTYICKNGLWFNTKTFTFEIQPCEAICNPPCQNNGTCIMPNVCHCKGYYTGKYCEFENIPCIGFPPTPIFSMKRCNAELCTITCISGRKFPDGSTVVNVFCKNGKWIPAKPEWTVVPNCEPVCEPNCVNGGKCVDTNVCFCPHDFRGPQCQYSVSACDISKLNFNGGYNCTGNAASFTCELTCAPGMVTEEPLSPVYTCKYSEGIFKPLNIPQCKIYGRPSSIEMVNISRHSEQEITVTHYSTSCLVWGPFHFKTFNGNVFSFKSTCTYLLLSDEVNNLFHVHIKLSYGAIKAIIIYINDQKYVIYANEKQMPVLLVDKSKEVFTIPSQLPELKVEVASGRSIIIYLTIADVYILWNLRDAIRVDVSKGMWNRTGGLCSQFDVSSGDHYKNVQSYASRWLVSSLTETCQHPIEETKIHSKEVRTAAKKFCATLKTNVIFYHCQNVLSIDKYIEACEWAYYNSEESIRTEHMCQFVSMFVKACSIAVQDIKIDWRDSYSCSIKCLPGQVYTSCMPVSQPTCISDEVKPNTLQRFCEEGCICPSGMALYSDKCINRENCPCIFRGKFFPQGRIIQKDCNQCACIGGKWSCTDAKCKGVCTAFGDPHYKTFDGRKYSFLGKCSYNLLVTDDIIIEAENSVCGNAFMQKMTAIETVGSSSCTKSVTIHFLNNTVIKLRQMRGIYMNNEEINKLPFVKGDLYIRKASTFLIQVSLKNILDVFWDGVNRVVIYADPILEGKTKGLCGTFNRNQKDDLLTPEGDIEQNVVSFVTKWKTKDQCENPVIIDKSNPCEVNIQNKQFAERYCANLTGTLFEECHGDVNPMEYYEDCLYDVCSCEEDKLSSCLCPIMNSYAEDCSRQGISIDWRNSVNECAIICPVGQSYHICGDSCQRSCTDIAQGELCNETCFEGCYCPLGYTLDDNEQCIPINDCTCIHNGKKYLPSHVEIIQKEGIHHTCECKNAIWQCKLSSKEDIEKYSTTDNTSCNAYSNMEFTPCESPEEITCKNMHNPPQFTSAVCHPGCVCKKGYVLDSIIRQCVKPNECPCHHGGQSYSDGDTMKEECNTCTCSNGKWECTKNDCPGICSSWGDTHFQTFDGRFYDFQGTCDYTFAKGQLPTGEMFSVAIEIVPCGSGGTSCAKSVTLNVGSGNKLEQVTFTRDKKLPTEKSFKRILIYEAGVFVIAIVPELSISLQWDKGTRAGLQVDPKWRNKVSGLCGNFNDNAEDDFQTPSGGLIEVSSVLFADSWKLQHHCPEPSVVPDPCALHPHRKFWAVEKCNLLKTSPILKKCHAEVPIDEYINRCIFDACACDQGGDCECICTVFAAYAQECSARGVYIKWRKSDHCPIQCEAGAEYSANITTCPDRTCDNVHKYESDFSICHQLPCVEGCAKKGCPPGLVFKNSSTTECVLISSCTCMNLDGIIYYENDVMDQDACHSCVCSKGKKVCTGVPCVPSTLPPTPFPQIYEETPCISGWTDWLKLTVPIQGKEAIAEHVLKAYNDKHVNPDVKIIMAVCSANQLVNVTCQLKSNFSTSFEEVHCDVDNIIQCDGSCSELQFKVSCNCEIILPPVEIATVHALPPITHQQEQTVATEKTKITTISDTRCPAGFIWSDCKQKCDQLCMYYEKYVRYIGECLLDSCISGCVSFGAYDSCTVGHYWRDDNTCVAIEDCTCVTRNGSIAKPGSITYESECQLCQCVKNEYICVNICTTTTTRFYTVPPKEIPTTTEKITTMESISITEEISYSTTIEITSEMSTLFIVPKVTVSPLPLCDSNRFIPIEVVNFNASSSSGINNKPEHAKLVISGDSVTTKQTWRAAIPNLEQFLHLDLGFVQEVYGIIVAGNPTLDEYVTSFKVLYSIDGVAYSYLMVNNEPVVFQGPRNSYIPERRIFDSPFEARFIHIQPISWQGWISLQLQVIGCGEQIFTSTTVPVCTEPMGLESGMMHPEQITVSSVLAKDFVPQHASLSSSLAWIPFTASSNQWIQFDFLGSRVITGITTKGSPMGEAWVEAYKVTYSHDGVHWNSILDENKLEKVFQANVDSFNVHTNFFEPPLEAHYLRLYTLRWSTTPALRIEVLGCFVPYPTLQHGIEISSTTEPVTAKTPCAVCHGIPPYDLCNCTDDKLWDGEKCTSQATCPCIVGVMRYEVGSTYIIENCYKCTCMLGGIPDCKLEECPSCKQGLQRNLTKSCSCECVPCPEGTRLCPTSNICINESLWCNGYKDCPDDESECTTITTTTITTTTTSLPTTTAKIIPGPVCPPIECPPGYKPVFVPVSVKSSIKGQPTASVKSGKSWPSPFDNSERSASNTKQSVKNGIPADSYLAALQAQALAHSGGVKGAKGIKVPTTKGSPILTDYAVQQQRQKEKMEVVVCPDWRCEANETMCAKPVCPPGTKLRIMWTGEKCPTYECIIPPQLEKECSIDGRFIMTFDGLAYRYDICDHIVAQDRVYGMWRVKKIHKCPYIGQCTTYLVLLHAGDTIEFFTNFTTTYNGYKYSVGQLQMIGNQLGSFIVRQVSSTFLIFASTELKFTIIWTSTGNIKIIIDSSLYGMLDGLCGYFDYDVNNDKLKRNGLLSMNTQEFGDSWKDGTEICEAKVCPIEVQAKAMGFCNVLKDAPFDVCGYTLHLEQHVAKCIEFICACSESSSDINKCHCDALQEFVTVCSLTQIGVDLSTWRMKYDCAVHCISPLVYRDCYNRQCEPNCNALLQQQDCSRRDDVCYPGCYCPEGLLKEGNTCVRPAQCRDCVCKGTGTTEYSTFDLIDVPLEGFCNSYILVKYNDYKSSKSAFEIILTYGPCVNEVLGSVCQHGLTIITDKYEILLAQSENPNEIFVKLNNNTINSFPYTDQNIQMIESPGRSVSLSIVSLELDVTLMTQNRGFSVRLPSYVYNNKTEGLCGKCNGNPEDDILMPGDRIPETAEEFGNSWNSNYTTDVISECESGKVMPVIIIPTCVTPSHETDPCILLTELDVFQQCHAVVNVNKYIDQCHNDLCHGQDGSYCHSLELYAKECQHQGICFDWRTANLCPYGCPKGFEYKGCSISCDVTCDNYKQLNEDSAILCPGPLSERCVCPSGKVIGNGTCIRESRCHPCDKYGHYIGDKWKRDNCTMCICTGEGDIQCQKKECPSEIICPSGYISVNDKNNDDICCSKYICVHEAVTSTCIEPVKPNCGTDQVLKFEITSNNCTTYYCACKPRDECPDVAIMADVELLPGMVKVEVKEGCCPSVILQCHNETCPPPKECPQFYHLIEQKNTEECCSHYTCEIPKNKCIYEYQWIAAQKGGERKRTEYEIYKEEKQVGDVWSDGPCRQCSCTESTPHGVCTSLKCAPQPEFKDFVIKSVFQYNECCPVYKSVACKFNNKTYEVGEVWSIEGNPCVNISCMGSLERGVLSLQETVQTCNRDCKPGWKYTLPEHMSKQCCGTCQQEQCIDDIGQLHLPGTTWKSSDNCTSFECEKHLQILSFSEVCPNVTGCSPENIYQDGCCKKCVTLPQEHKVCHPVSLPINETEKLVRKDVIGHKMCFNKRFAGFTHCKGQCDTFEWYNDETSRYGAACQCCIGVEYEKKQIEMICDDKFEFYHTIEVPTDCDCQQCGGNEAKILRNRTQSSTIHSLLIGH